MLCYVMLCNVMLVCMLVCMFVCMFVCMYVDKKEEEDLTTGKRTMIVSI